MDNFVLEGGEQMSQNNSILTRVFTQNTLKDFINCPNDVSILSSIVKRYEISYNDETKNESVISEIYQYLGTSYRNEYFYKNTLLNKSHGVTGGVYKARERIHRGMLIRDY